MPEKLRIICEEVLEKQGKRIANKNRRILYKVISLPFVPFLGLWPNDLLDHKRFEKDEVIVRSEHAVPKKSFWIEIRLKSSSEILVLHRFLGKVDPEIRGIDTQNLDWQLGRFLRKASTSDLNLFREKLSSTAND